MTARPALRGGRPLRYLMVGALNTGLGLLFYPALLWVSPALRVHYLIALGIAQVVCLAFAFVAYKVVVFRARGNLLREFGTFSSFYLMIYALNWLALPLLVEAIHLPPAIAQVGFSGLVLVTSYFWHSRFTFKSSGETL